MLRIVLFTIAAIANSGSIVIAFYLRQSSLWSVLALAMGIVSIVFMTVLFALNTRDARNMRSRLGGIEHSAYGGL